MIFQDVVHSIRGNLARLTLKAEKTRRDGMFPGFSNQSDPGKGRALRLALNFLTRIALVHPTSLGKVVAIEVHHFAPCSHEVLHKRLLRVVTGIDFRDCPELGV